MFENTSSIVKGHYEVVWWFKLKDMSFQDWRDVVRCMLKLFIEIIWEEESVFVVVTQQSPKYSIKRVEIDNESNPCL